MAGLQKSTSSRKGYWNGHKIQKVDSSLWLNVPETKTKTANSQQEAIVYFILRFLWTGGILYTGRGTVRSPSLCSSSPKRLLLLVIFSLSALAMSSILQWKKKYEGDVSLKFVFHSSALYPNFRKIPVLHKREGATGKKISFSVLPHRLPRLARRGTVIKSITCLVLLLNPFNISYGIIAMYIAKGIHACVYVGNTFF